MNDQQPNNSPLPPTPETLDECLGQQVIVELDGTTHTEESTHEFDWEAFSGRDVVNLDARLTIPQATSVLLKHGVKPHDFLEAMGIPPDTGESLGQSVNDPPLLSRSLRSSEAMSQQSKPFVCVPQVGPNNRTVSIKKGKGKVSFKCSTNEKAIKCAKALIGVMERFSS